MWDTVDLINFVEVSYVFWILFTWFVVMLHYLYCVCLCLFVFQIIGQQLNIYGEIVY